MKSLKFSVCEQTGRTFELPLEKAREILKADYEDIAEWDENSIAVELYNNYSDDIDRYEKENSYFECYVQDIEVKEI